MHLGALRPRPRRDPAADDPERDRFLLSKGHGPAAFYAVLAAKGFIPVDVARRLRRRFDSPLGHHPDRALIPGVEIASGSLGHGLADRGRRALALEPAHGRVVSASSATASSTRARNYEAIAARRAGSASTA